jgi:hypothetical protein
MMLCGLVGFTVSSCEEESRAGVDSENGEDDKSDEDWDVETEVKHEVCEGDACYCLRLAVIGTSDSAANDKDVTAFVDWLNTKSSCKVSMYEDRVELTADFLGDFDIVLLQLLADSAYGPFWTYSDDELKALRSWVERGGGMITLTGYSGNMSTDEVATINSVLTPVSGISYNNDRYLADGCDTCWCWGNTVPIYGWNQEHEIAQNIDQVGAMWGYSINAPEGATVVASEAGRNAAVAMEIGKGKVFAFADEWVIFTNQWRDGETTPGGAADQYNVCYDMEKEQFNNAENYFQIPQFWYNVIKWVAPPNNCFVLQDPDLVV